MSKLGNETELPYPQVEGWTVDQHGVRDAYNSLICHRPLWAQAIGHHDGTWSTRIVFYDLAGHRHTHEFARHRLHVRTDQLATELAARGLPMIGGKERAVFRFITLAERADVQSQ